MQLMYCKQIKENNFIVDVGVGYTHFGRWMLVGSGSKFLFHGIETCYERYCEQIAERTEVIDTVTGGRKRQLVTKKLLRNRSP